MDSHAVKQAVLKKNANSYTLLPFCPQYAVRKHTPLPCTYYGPGIPAQRSKETTRSKTQPQKNVTRTKAGFSSDIREMYTATNRSHKSLLPRKDSPRYQIYHV